MPTNQLIDPAQPRALGAVVKDAVDSLQRITEDCKQMGQQADEWIKQKGNGDAACLSHKIKLKVDAEATRRESVKKSRIVVVHAACPECDKQRQMFYEREMLRASGVPKVLLDCEFDTFEPKGGSERLALSKAQAFAAKPRGVFVLTGLTGCGKDHLAVSIMRVVLRAGERRVRFFRQATLLEARRETYGDRKQDWMRLIMRTRLFVLSELTEAGTGKDEGSTLYETINAIYEEQIPAVITTNLPKEAFQKALGDRLWDRLKQCVFALCLMDGGSRRASKREEYLR